MKSESQRNKLEIIEISRGLAALAVVFFHANSSAIYVGLQPYNFLSFGQHGVDFFFVLSGFIIIFVHEGDIGRPNEAREYVFKRMIRLLPLLWVVVAAAFALRIAGGSVPNARSLGTSLLLYPSSAEPIPLVVWTLRHEALFYVAFAILIYNRKAGTVLFALWSLGVVVQMVLGLIGMPIGGVYALVFSSYHFDFFIGGAIAAFYRRAAFRRSFLPLGLSVLVLASVFIIQERFQIRRTSTLDYTSLAALFWTPVLGLAFAFLLYGLLCVGRITKAPRSLVVLGAASYAIYLVHTPVNSVAQRVAQFLPEAILPSGFAHIFLVTVGVATGIALHLCIEKPVARQLRSALLSPRGIPDKSPA